MIHLKRLFPLVLLCILAQPIVSVAQIPQVMVGDTGLIPMKWTGNETHWDPSCKLIHYQSTMHDSSNTEFQLIEGANQKIDGPNRNSIMFLPTRTGLQKDQYHIIFVSDEQRFSCSGASVSHYTVEAIGADSVTTIRIVQPTVIFQIDTPKKEYSSIHNLLSLYNNTKDSVLFGDWQLVMGDSSIVSIMIDSGSLPISSYEEKSFTRRKQLNLTFTTTLAPTDTARTFPAKLLTHIHKAGKDTVYENNLTFIMPSLPQVGVKQEQENETIFSIYPNPSAGEAIVFVGINKPEEVNIEVYDLLGNKKIALGRGSYLAGNYQFRLNKDQLSPGEYFVRLQTGKFVTTKKLIVQ